MHTNYLALVASIIVALFVIATVGAGASFWVSAKAKTPGEYQTAFENACIFLMAGGSAAGLILICCYLAVIMCRPKLPPTEKELVALKRKRSS